MYKELGGRQGERSRSVRLKERLKEPTPYHEVMWVGWVGAEDTRGHTLRLPRTRSEPTQNPRAAYPFNGVSKAKETPD